MLILNEPFFRWAFKAKGFEVTYELVQVGANIMIYNVFS